MGRRRAVAVRAPVRAAGVGSHAGRAPALAYFTRHCWMLLGRVIQLIRLRSGMECLGYRCITLVLVTLVALVIVTASHRELRQRSNPANPNRLRHVHLRVFRERYVRALDLRRRVTCTVVADSHRCAV